jgi:hypothetical protein
MRIDCQVDFACIAYTAFANGSRVYTGLRTSTMLATALLRNVNRPYHHGMDSFTRASFISFPYAVLQFVVGRL